MTCWYCHWGWPKEVAEIYRRGVEETDEDVMNYGPGHIVWEDENFDDESIQSCIDTAKGRGRRILRYSRDFTSDEIATVIRSLEELLVVPEDVRCCEPEDYDGKHPQNYPPRNGLTMVRNPFSHEG